MNRLLTSLTLCIAVTRVTYAFAPEDQLSRDRTASSGTDTVVSHQTNLQPDSEAFPLLDSPGSFYLHPIVPGEVMSLSTFEQDSSQQPRKQRLLPENLSFFERAMWGESGMLRGMGIASPLTPESRKHELSVRRTMLTMHQIGGFVTLALMGTTAYFGQHYLDHGQRNDRDMHQTFVAATIASYAATGLLAIFAPPPVIRRDEFSTTSLHKILAWVHVAGMIITPILGAAISRRGSSYYDQAHFHQAAAYLTTAVFAASMIIITF